MYTVYPAIFAFLGYIPDFLIEEDARFKTGDFRTWMRFRRQLKGLTAIAFAQQLGIPVLTLREWEQLLKEPNHTQQAEILRLLEPLMPSTRGQ